MSAYLSLVTRPWLVAAFLALAFVPTPAFADDSSDEASDVDEVDEEEYGADYAVGVQIKSRAEEIRREQEAAASGASDSAASIDPITGAQLGWSGPRQAAHIIIKRNERAEGLHELSISNPVQINGKFTQHIGASLDYLYHLREAFAFGVGGTYNYYAAQTQFTDDLAERAMQAPFAAPTLLMDYEAHAGVEVSPIYGKFALFDWSVVQFGLYFGAYGGVGHTKIQLRAADSVNNRGRTFGDTGLRPVGIFNAGMRMFLSKHMALRVEVRNTMYSNDMSRINGCTKNDITGGGAPAASCNLDAFYDRQADGGAAAELLKDPSSDVLHNVAFVAAFSVLF